jgi:hypothetical protein
MKACVLQPAGSARVYAAEVGGCVAPTIVEGYVRGTLVLVEYIFLSSVILVTCG